MAHAMEKPKMVEKTGTFFALHQEKMEIFIYFLITYSKVSDPNN